MKDVVTVFFFANNNHLSNVKTLQSIYRQDYPHIDLIVCNDCTYGFQSERLLNNFEAGRGANIEHIYYQENPHPMGECLSQLQLWNRITSEYYFVIHSGDILATPTALRLSINNLKLDQSLAAVVNGLELRDSLFKTVISTTTITKNPEAQGVYGAADKTELHPHQVRDCMTIYRMKVLKERDPEEYDATRYLGKQALPALLESGKRIAVRPVALCYYSEQSVQDMAVAEPTKLGRDTLRNIQQLLQEEPDRDESPRIAAPRKPKKNIHRVLFKLSSLKKIGAYGLCTLLLAIAAGLFLHLQEGYWFWLGLGFLALAACFLLLTLAMLACNLYYKKNPQRLVEQ